MLLEIHFLVLDFSFELIVCHILKCFWEKNPHAQMIYGLFFNLLATLSSVIQATEIRDGGDICILVSI